MREQMHRVPVCSEWVRPASLHVLKAISVTDTLLRRKVLYYVVVEKYGTERHHERAPMKYGKQG